MAKLKIHSLDLEYSDLFFTADTHFFHNNIIQYCNRPFENVWDMNERLIQRWNSVVSKNDIIIHCGDFIFGGKREWENILSRLNGKIVLCPGDYDELSSIPVDKFLLVSDIVELTIEDKEIVDNQQSIVCCHYPMSIWNGKNKGFWHVRGHMHGTIRSQFNQYDVGVDCNNYTPIDYNTLKTIMTKQFFK